MADEELAACRKEIEDLRGKLRRIVPEWKALKLQAQHKADGAVMPTTSPSSTSSANSDAAALKAKLKQIVPDWKRLREENKVLKESEFASRARADQLESELGEAGLELARMRNILQKVQERETELDSAYSELANIQESAKRVLELESDLADARFELEKQRELSERTQELESVNAATMSELQSLREALMETESVRSALHAAELELKSMRNATNESQVLQSKLDAAYAELERVTLQVQTSNSDLDSARLELEKLSEVSLMVENLESQLQLANAELESMRASTEEFMQQSDRAAKLESLVDQQGAEISMLKRRLEKAMQRPSKLELQKVKHENAALQKKLSVESDVIRALQHDIVEMRSSSEKADLLSDELADLQARFSICQASRDSLIIDGDKLEAENRMLHMQIDELHQISPSNLIELKQLYKHHLSEGKSLSSAIQDETNFLKERLRLSIDEVSDLKSALDETTSRLEVANSENQELLTQIQNLELLLADKESDFAASDSKVQGPLGLQVELDGSEEGPANHINVHSEVPNLVVASTLKDLDGPQNDSDKFHFYQNRIETLEEEVLELSTQNTQLQQTLFFMKSELESCQEAIYQSSSDLRYESNLLLQLLSEKDQLIEDLSSQLGDFSAMYVQKAETLKSTIAGFRKHNEFLQEMLSFQGREPNGLEMKNESIEMHKHILEMEQQLEQWPHAVNSKALNSQLGASESLVITSDDELREAHKEIENLRRQLEDSVLSLNEKDLELKKALKATIEFNEKSQELMDSRKQIEQLQMQLQASETRTDDQEAHLKNAEISIEDQKRKLEDAEAQIHAQKSELNGLYVQLKEERDLVHTLRNQVEDHRAEMEAERSRFKQDICDLEEMRSRIDEERSELNSARLRNDELSLQLEAAQTRIEDLCLQLESAKSQIEEQSFDLESLQNRVEEQQRLGQAIVHNYNELRGHYELLLTKVEAEAAILNELTRSQSSRSLSPRKSHPSTTVPESVSKQDAPARSASVPVRKRRTLKDFLIKLFERPMYDENGKPIARVDLSEDTTFVWDPVKKKYIDLNAPEVEEKPISKPPPRPSFALAPPSASSSKPGAGPLSRMSNRSLTGSRYALPEGITPDAKISPRPSVSAASTSSRYALLEPAPGSLSKPSDAKSSSLSTSFSTSSTNKYYRPPAINSFEDVIVVTSDYHSLIASLVALQKDLASAKRSKLEMDLYVSTLVRQIKERLAKAPREPVMSGSIEVTKLICCVLAMAGIVSAIAQVTT